MLKVSDIQAVIFDVDDTLLDNQPPGEILGLHEQSRLAAAHEVGKRHGSAGLQNLTPEQSTQAFRLAKVHTLQATVWQMLFMAGEVFSPDEIEPDHPLLQEIMQLKEELHEDILRTKGREVPGAVHFVQAWVTAGFDGKLAVASTANRRDIDIFFEITGLNQYFPPRHIISRQDLTHPKPHPEPFNLAFAALGLPETARPFVVAFEDDPRGVTSAKAAGLYTCAITSRYSKKELADQPVAPDLIADSYTEFEQLFGLSV